MTTTATVPDVVGLTEDQAEETLKNAGLKAGTVRTVSSNSVTLGNVISQSPAAGTTVSSGSAVALAVSAGTTRLGNFSQSESTTGD